MKLKKVRIGSGFHFLVKCEINKLPAYLILDTGASMTMFDAEQASKYLSPSEKIEMRQSIQGVEGTTNQVNSVQLKSLKIERIFKRKITIGMMNLKNLNEQYKQFGLEPIQGILGADILSKHGAWIDLFREEIILNP